MKIRHPLLIKALGFVGAWALRLWIPTLRYSYRPVGPNLEPNQLAEGDRYIYAFWHENMLLLPYHYGRPDIWVLISRHADGRLIAEVCRRMSARVVEGSTTRGGIEAVRQMLRLAKGAHLALTPDGPRGPRRHVQPGLIYLAARTGLPIVPMGIGYDRPWRTRSWDRLAVPRPFSRACCVTAAPIAVPPEADLEVYRLRVEQALRWASETAEKWAETGNWPEIDNQGSGNQGSGEQAA